MAETLGAVSRTLCPTVNVQPSLIVALDAQ